jgi:hypothetical protein
MLLSYFLGRGEAAHVPLPDELVTAGRAYRDLFRSAGFDALSITVGGGLRYEASAELASPPRERPPGARRNVVLALSISPLYSAILIDAFLEAFAEPAVLADGAPVHIVVKPHPYPPRAVFERPNGYPAWFSVDERAFTDVLAEADAVVYSGLTGSGLEAVAAGIPAVKFLPPILDIDAADLLAEGVVPVCTSSDARAVLIRVLEDPAVPDRAAVRDTILEPVNYPGWAAVLRRAGLSETAA